MTSKTLNIFSYSQLCEPVYISFDVKIVICTGYFPIFGGNK